MVSPAEHFVPFVHVCIVFQVCVPFLLFCLGMDPKLDMSKLSTVLADLGSRPAGAVTSAPATLSSHGTAEDRVSLGKENVPRTPQDHAPLSGHPAGQEKTPSGLDGPAASAGKVLSLLASPSPSPSKKKSDRYQSTPKLALVLSGCHAVLQFLGKKEVIQGSLLETGIHVQYMCSTLYVHVLLYSTCTVRVCIAVLVALRCLVYD